MNGQVVLPGRVANDVAVLIAGSSIAGVIHQGHLPAEIERIDVEGRWITPGLIDIHTHGALGHTFNEPDEGAFNIILQENARRGVTGLLATLAVAPMDDLLHVLEFVRQWMTGPRAGSQVFGAHLEGPYIHPSQCGALDPSCLRLWQARPLRTPLSEEFLLHFQICLG